MTSKCLSGPAQCQSLRRRKQNKTQYVLSRGYHRCLVAVMYRLTTMPSRPVTCVKEKPTKEKPEMCRRRSVDFDVEPDSVVRAARIQLDGDDADDVLETLSILLEVGELQLDLLASVDRLSHPTDCIFVRA